MKIIGLDGISKSQLKQDLQAGAKFVLYQYTFSIIIMSFRRSSSIYYIRPNESDALPGLKFTALSMLLGWWGIPWGPIYTLQVIYNNSKGGKDVTDEVAAALTAGVGADGS
ncbi:MAG: hypothetical protein OEY93_06705 [Anaerolineae bacterium]|nr:hypothetical protein [Anaerolineae bacterium]